MSWVAFVIIKIIKNNSFIVEKVLVDNERKRFEQWKATVSAVCDNEAFQTCPITQV